MGHGVHNVSTTEANVSWMFRDTSIWLMATPQTRRQKLLQSATKGVLKDSRAGLRATVCVFGLWYPGTCMYPGLII